jgi:hypothetical protein
MFGVLPNPIDDLPFAIVIESGMLSSLSWRIHPVFEGGLNTGSWAIKCFRQGISGYSDIVTRFRDIHHECDLMTLKFEPSKLRVSLWESADLVWETKDFEAWQDDRECERWRRGCFP